jgi:hypothetical protein
MKISGRMTTCDHHATAVLCRISSQAGKGKPRGGSKPAVGGARRGGNAGRPWPAGTCFGNKMLAGMGEWFGIMSRMCAVA